MRTEVYDRNHYLKCSKSITPKVGKSKLWLLCSAPHLMFICLQSFMKISPTVFKLQSKQNFVMALLSLLNRLGNVSGGS